MSSPFDPEYDDAPDLALVARARQGEGAALEELVRRHQPFVLNLAWKMVLNPADAEDVTQEVMIKVLTGLSSFEGRSGFRTWLYRIAVNHVLNMRRRKMETLITGFDEFGAGLAALPDHRPGPEEEVELKETIDEVRISCTASMLLCLDRPQRLAVILGDFFAVDHRLGAELLEISPEAFRQRLSRARREMYNWMNDRCSLVNHSNPCKCPQKTRAFIEQGWVDPKELRFNANYTRRLREVLARDPDEDCTAVEAAHREIFRDHPFRIADPSGMLDVLLGHPELKRTYDL